MSDTPLPEDIKQFLEHTASTRGLFMGSPMAKALLAKYAPKSKTLADFGTFRWRYEFVANKGMPGNGGMRDAIPKGAHNYDERFPGAPDPVPWPEIEGINPASYLNDGWVWHHWCHVPDDWEVLFNDPVVKSEAHLPDEIGDASAAPATPHSSLAVLCRPPKEDPAP